MRPSTKTWLGLGMLSLTLLIADARATCAARPDVQGWYQPIVADFRPVYDRDQVNKKYEAWDGGNGYWTWVQSFYRGYRKRILGITVFRQAGWTAAGQSMEARIVAEPARQHLRCALNRLGRDIAGEWAKDDGHCRISTGDLQRWGGWLRQAGDQEDGSGQELLQAVASIQAEADRHLSRQP